MEWLHNGEKILEEVDRMTTSQSGGRASLRISNVVSADAGEYCCQAVNSAGFQASKATLTVGSSAGAATEVNGVIPVSVEVMDGRSAESAPRPSNDSASEGPARAASGSGSAALLKDLESKVAQEKTETTLECQIEGILFVLILSLSSLLD